MEEYQISHFFSQFGYITRYALKRSLFGKNYRECYIEFDNKDTGNIIKESIDDTIIYGNKLNIEVINNNEIKSDFWLTNNLKNLKKNKDYNFKENQWNRISVIHNLIFKFNEWLQVIINDESNINSYLKQQGIDYQFHGIVKYLYITMYIYIFMIKIRAQS